MHLVNWVTKDSARVASDDGDVYKITIAEADSWETPRPPFEVCTVFKDRYPTCILMQGEFCCIPAHWLLPTCGIRSFPIIQAIWHAG